MINIELKDNYRKKCVEFANKIIERNDQFSRLMPKGINKDSELGKKIAVQRTLMGKYGEIAFLQLLEDNRLINDEERKAILKEMFDIKEGQENVDFYDFKTKIGKKVDVKAAYLYFHQNLLVNKDQFDVSKDKQKEIYVGVKVKTYSYQEEYEYKENGKTKKGKVNIVKDIETNVKNVEVYGYVTRENLDKLTYVNTNKKTGEKYESKWDEDRGEAPCKSVLLNELSDINILLDMF